MKDGSKDPQSSDEQVAGKMLFPNSGMRSPYWSEGPFLPFCPAPEGLIPDLLDGPSGNLGGGDKIKRPDWHPRPNPGEGAPDLSPPDNIDPGFRIPEHDGGFHWLSSPGYNNPNYGLPSDGGGAFIGMGRFDAACNIPNEMQPGIPPDGLFGPDAFIPDWGRPGYRPPSDATSPFIPGYSAETMGLPIGLDPVMPFPIPIPDLPEFSELDLPDIAPSQNFPDFGIVVRRGSEIIEDLYAGIPRAKVKVIYPAPPPPKPPAPKEETEEEGESKAWYERAWDWLKGVARTVAGLASAVGRAIGRAIGAAAKALYHLAAAYVELGKIYYKAWKADLNYKLELLRNFWKDPDVPLITKIIGSGSIFWWGALNTGLSTFEAMNFENEQEWATYCSKYAKELNKRIGSDWKYWDVCVDEWKPSISDMPIGYHAYVGIKPKNRIHRILNPGYNIDPWYIPGIAPMYPKRRF